MAKQRRGNDEMEREGAVCRGCWTRGACAAPLTESSLACLSNTWSCCSLPKHFYFTFHTTKNKALKTFCDAFQMLFLTCSLCIRAHQHPAFSSADHNGRIQMWGMVLKEFNGSKHVKSCLLFCSGINSSSSGCNISHCYFYHLSACSVTVPHAPRRDNTFWQQNHLAWPPKPCFSPVIGTKKWTGACIWATSLLGD